MTISDVFLRCNHQKQLFLDLFRLFGTNNDRQQYFAQDYLVKRAQNGSKWPTNMNYYFSLKHRFNDQFQMFSDHFSVIVNEYFQCFFGM